jgi:O-antigen ligase
MMLSILSEWWNSKTARRVDLVSAAFLSCILLRLAWQENLTWIGAVVVCVVVVFLTAVRWPYGALIVLIGTSAMPGFFVEIGGWKARPEHFAAVVVLFAVAVWMLQSHYNLRLERLDYWILGFVLLNFVSSAFGSPAPASTLRWALQNSLAILSYFLIRGMVRDFKILRQAFGVLLGVGVLESIYGILCYASHDIFGTSVGMQVGQYHGDVAAPYGSLFEANLLGAYTACCAVSFLALYLFQRRRLRYLICFLVTSLAAVLSFSRASLMALVLAGGYVFWQSHRRSEGKDGSKKVALGVLGVLAAFVLILATGSVGGVIRERFMNLYEQGLADDTTISRFIIIQEALQDIPGHLLLGMGTASFNLTFDWAIYVPEWTGEKTWIGNTPLRILHDTGVLGLAAFLGFFATVAYKLRHARETSTSSDAILVGLTAGTIVYAISFESTDGTILAFCWIQFGLLASALLLLEKSQESRTAEFLEASDGPQ